MHNQSARQLTTIPALIQMQASCENRAHVIPTEEGIASCLLDVPDWVARFERDELHAAAICVEDLRTAGDVTCFSGVATQCISEADISRSIRNFWNGRQLPGDAACLDIQSDRQSPSDGCLGRKCKRAIVENLGRNAEPSANDLQGVMSVESWRVQGTRPRTGQVDHHDIELGTHEIQLA